MKRRTLILLLSLLALFVPLTWAQPQALEGARGRLPFLIRPLPPTGPIPDQLVVKFRRGVPAQARAALHARAGGRVLNDIPQLNIQTVRLGASQATRVYRSDPNVEWIEPANYVSTLIAAPNDPGYHSTRIFYDIDDNPWPEWVKWDVRMVQSVDGWDIWPGQYFISGSKGSAAVLIAVIDSGIDESHPDFKNAGGASTDAALGGQLALALNRTIRFGSVTHGAHDLHGHGTHVAGIAAASTNNSIGTVGIGYNANVMSIRVVGADGSGSDSDVAQGIVYAADAGALICNVSLGSTRYSQAMQDAVDYAWNKGMLVIAAAGNSGDPFNPTLPPPPSYPAALSRVLAVSATDHNDNFSANYSSWGDYVGVSAPGGDLDWDLLAIVGIYSTTPTYHVTINDPPYGETGEGVEMTYGFLFGTSMACPQVTGLAALYAGMKGYTQTPGTPLRIWQALQRGADGVPGLEGWNPYLGYGRINVYNTLALDEEDNARGDTVGSILGQVRYRGTIVANANIVATPVGGGAAGSASSNSDGSYRIPNILAGTYNVTATVFGESQTVNNVQVTAGCDMPGIDFNVGGTGGGGGVRLSSLKITPSTVPGSKSATGKVVLTGSAPAGGKTIDLSSSNPSIAYPVVSSVTVPKGKSSKTFKIGTVAVASTVNVVISATDADITKTATLKVRPIGVKSVVLNPNPVVGGNNVTGTVTLEAPAGPGDITVTLLSTDPSVANPTVGSLVVPAGQVSGNFTITTTDVSAVKSATIKATANGITKQKKLTVNP